MQLAFEVDPPIECTSLTRRALEGAGGRIVGSTAEQVAALLNDDVSNEFQLDVLDLLAPDGRALLIARRLVWGASRDAGIVERFEWRLDAPGTWQLVAELDEPYGDANPGDALDTLLVEVRARRPRRRRPGVRPAPRGCIQVWPSLESAVVVQFDPVRGRGGPTSLPRGGRLPLLPESGLTRIGRSMLVQSMMNDLRRQALEAAHQLAPGEALHPAALVLDLLASSDRPDERLGSAGHRLAVATLAMRQLVADAARGRLRSSPRSGAFRIAMDESLPIAAPEVTDEDVVVLDAQLDELRRMDRGAADAAALRVFLGLSEQSCADVLGVSIRTVRADLAVAGAWLADRSTRP